MQVFGDEWRKRAIFTLVYAGQDYGVDVVASLGESGKWTLSSLWIRGRHAKRHEVDDMLSGPEFNSAEAALAFARQRAMRQIPSLPNA